MPHRVYHTIYIIIEVTQIYLSFNLKADILVEKLAVVINIIHIFVRYFV